MPEPTSGPAAQPPAQPSVPPAGSTKAGLAQAIGEQFSFEKSIGGVRGVLESVLPLTVFSVVYGVTRDLRASCVAALVPALVLMVWRLVRREPLTQAVSGVIGVAIGAFLAVRTGKAENFFLPSIIKNAAYAGAYALSILLRWPIVGVLLGFLLGEATHWRSVPARARAYSVATWIWVGMFLVRLVVQVPLYLMGRTATLGLVSVPLGLPLFGLAIWLTWLVIRRVPVAHPPQHHGEHEGHGHHARREADPVDESEAGVAQG